MERKNSITLSSITNFLETGALLRRGNQWILIEGPFKPVCDANSDEITLFCPDFYQIDDAVRLAGNRNYCLSVEQMREAFELYLASTRVFYPPLAKASWMEPSKADFEVAFNISQARIKNNEIKKSVPAVFARSAQKVTNAEKAQMILHLLQAPTVLHVYGFWQNGEGMLGATPEVLFNYSEGILETMAFAGTCPKSEVHLRSSLLEDPKEKQEHQLVLDDLTALLAKYGSVKSEGPYILELPTLYHLRTDIHVRCEIQPDYLGLTKELHPTPALGVAPRDQGYKWMQQFPGQAGRRRFGAPFGFFAAKEAVCVVAIRNLQWNNNESMIGSGCGLVADSEIEREWRELYQKRQSVRKILGLEQ